MITPIATVRPHDSGWGIVVSDFLIYLPERTVAVAVASVINGTCEGLARQRDEALTALGHLQIEAARYLDSGVNREALEIAVQAAGAVRARGEATS